MMKIVLSCISYLLQVYSSLSCNWYSYNWYLHNTNTAIFYSWMMLIEFFFNFEITLKWKIIFRSKHELFNKSNDIIYNFCIKWMSSWLAIRPMVSTIVYSFPVQHQQTNKQFLFENICSFCFSFDAFIYFKAVTASIYTLNENKWMA